MYHGGMTNLESQIRILAELYEFHKLDEDLKDFIEFNDVGLPLAYFANEGLVTLSNDAKEYVTETFELLLGELGLKDTGFQNIDQILFN